jgi:hypothetical protein
MGDWFVQHKISNAQPCYLDEDKGVFKVPHPATNCGEAYLMKSDVAKKVYEASVPFDLVSDWELAYQYYTLDLNVYWWVPPLVRQGSRDGTYVSALDEGQRR